MCVCVCVIVKCTCVSGIVRCVYVSDIVSVSQLARPLVFAVVTIVPLDFSDWHD